MNVTITPSPLCLMIYRGERNNMLYQCLRCWAGFNQIKEHSVLVHLSFIVSSSVFETVWFLMPGVVDG